MLPFPGGIEAPENAALLFSAGAALLYLFVVDWQPSLVRSALKTLSTALLAYLAWQLGGPVLLVAALALGALGDLFLSRDGDGAFLGGLSAFLASHVAYIVLFLQDGAGVPVLSDEIWRGAAAVVVAGTTLAVLFILMRRVPPTLRLPVIAYSLTIMAMGIAALTTSKPLVIAGALLFMTSDTLLAWERFVSPAISSTRPLLRYAVWTLYYLAQLAIMLGFVLALS
jgi:uncharacterized membrane protein YhhN